MYRSDYWFANAVQFGNNFGPQVLLDFTATALALVAAVLVRHRRRRFGITPWAACLTLGALAVIGFSTLTRRAGATVAGGIQLHPFATLRSYRYSPADMLIYVGGNVLLFVPLGFFLYLAVRRSMIGCAVLATCVSIGVELCQIPIFSRSTDIDDVITNGLGGLIGAVLSAVVVAVGTWFRPSRPVGPARTTRPAGTAGPAGSTGPGRGAPGPGEVRSPAAASASDRAASPWRP